MTTTIDIQPETPTESEPTIGGLLASFAAPADVLGAAQSVREAGYHRFDVHSPHPIHGLDAIMQARRSWLPMAAAVGAAIGLAGGLWMAWWMNAVDYPFLISGKPLFSLAPSLPVAFELAILLAAFAVFGGALALGGLPAFSNRLFRIPAFARATNDRYFLAVDQADPRFDPEATRALLQQFGPLQIDRIPVLSEQEAELPRPLVLTAIVMGVLFLIPPVLIAKARSETSTKPRWSIISDMDHQPKFKAQTTNSLFADGRSMRPQVPGTIARGDLREDDRLYRGISPASSSRELAERFEKAAEATRTVSYQSTESSGQNVEPRWVSEFPVEVDEEFIRRGKQRYEIYCATCHGIGGDGDGLVTLRALELEQGTWVRPISLHDERIRQQPVGQLYNTIANGVRKMPGYASQIPVTDRWAIVAYLRALQRTRTATVEDVPEEILPTLRELN